MTSHVPYINKVAGFLCLRSSRSGDVVVVVKTSIKMVVVVVKTSLKMVVVVISVGIYILNACSSIGY